MPALLSHGWRLDGRRHAPTGTVTGVAGSPSVPLLLLLVAFAILVAIPACAASETASAQPQLQVQFRKKLIEYGWDVPTPAEMAKNREAMEKRPFDGLIFRLAGGHNAFVTKPLDPAKFKDDARILGTLKFDKFKDNFVLVWGSPAPDFDWFDDAHWKVIEANARLLVAKARPAGLRGICFDPEPYDFALWDYSKQPRSKTNSFAEYRAKVRQRGAQIMRAFEKELPGATILSFFHLSFVDRYAGLSDSDRAGRMIKERWGLMPDFFVGMLEGASPKARFIDGNESAYYYTSREQYFKSYHAMTQRALGLVPPDLREKYQRQVRAGQALYVDQNFALRQPDTERYVSYRMTPEERARWFEHNTYWALYTADEFVWCYSERMSWWNNKIPPGAEEAITNARSKIAEGRSLGFDIEPLIEAVKKR